MVPSLWSVYITEAAALDEFIKYAGIQVFIYHVFYAQNQ